MGVIPLAAGAIAGAGIGISKSDAFKAPKAKRPPNNAIDESALAARKREIDRARGAGSSASLYSRLGGAGSSGGLTVARTSLAGGSSLG